jgi:hypothetical protein
MEGNMRTTLSLLAAVFCVASVLSAQPHPNVLWTHTYGGGSDDKCWSVQQTKDGGFILSGWTWSFGAGQSDFYLVKTDGQGVPLWTRTFGGGERDESYCVRQTSDEGYIVSGFSNTFSLGYGDNYLVKTDWRGRTQWTHSYGGIGDECAREVQQTTDGGYIMGGITGFPSLGDWDFYLVKTNAQGDELWSRTFGGTGHDVGTTVQQTSDGGYILAGYSDSFGDDYDFYVVKTDNTGHQQWARTYGGDSDELANSVKQTSDGGFIIAGWTCSFGNGSADFYLVKTNNQGTIQWTRTYGGTGFDGASSVHQTPDGGYIVGGYSSSVSAGGYDFLLLKVDGNGNPLWKRTYGGRDDEVWGCSCRTVDGGYAIAGWTFSFGAGSDDYYLVKTGSDQQPLECESIEFDLPNQFCLYPNYPNPFNASTQITYSLPIMSKISLKVFNPMGQEVATLADEIQSAGVHSTSFGSLGLPSGTYFYRLQAGDFVQTKKMILLK